MLRVLITGMSGTGKSTMVAHLRALGQHAIDTDDGWSEPLPDGRQQWRVAAIRQLLDDDSWPILFVAGCEENQVQFHQRFDLIVLLSAPVAVLRSRLAGRSNNVFGKDPAELARILADVAEVEPLLRRVSDVELDATMPAADLAERILTLAAGRLSRPAAR